MFQLTFLYLQVIPFDAARRSAAPPPEPDPLTTGPFSDQSRPPSKRDSEPVRNGRRMVLKVWVSSIVSVVVLI